MSAEVAENGKSIHRKSVLRRLEKTTGIKTQAGLEMFKYFNDNFGSAVWGKVLEGIQAIEKELTPLSKSQVRRITKVQSDELREKELG